MGIRIQIIVPVSLFWLRYSKEDTCLFLHTYEGTIPSKIFINGIGTREARADESRSATHAAQPEAEAGPEQGGDKEDC